MARYFIDIQDRTDILRDDEGTEFVSLEALSHQARKGHFGRQPRLPKEPRCNTDGAEALLARCRSITVPTQGSLPNTRMSCRMTARMRPTAAAQPPTFRAS
jgi:hypothetical protein